MLENRVRLFKLFGFEIRLDPSWIIIALLITWSLVMGLFPALYPGQPGSLYWLMGVAGALGLFASIIVHEFFHSLVARRFGIPMRGITLFIFGGVAEMGDEPPSAQSEFLMAAAGPLTSLLLALLAYGLASAGRHLGWPLAVVGVLAYLQWINLILALFNLLPAFPLDGGRMLRAALWGWRKNLLWATRVASTLGVALAAVMIVWGLLSLLTGNVIGGLWIALIGWFLQTTARQSYQQLLTRQALQGEPVRRFMRPDPVTVPPSLSLRQLVDDYLLRYHFKMFPVLDHERLVACISAGQIAQVPREAWPRTTVREVANACTPDSVIGPEESAAQALARMHRTGNSRLLVVAGDRLVGILTLKDLLRFIALKLELGDA